MLSSLNDINVATPVQPQASPSTVPRSSLFAGLSVKAADTVSPTQNVTTPSNTLMTAAISSKPSENVSNVNTGIFASQPTGSVTYHQPMASVNRAPLNTNNYQSVSSPSSGILQPQVATSVTHSHLIPGAGGPPLNVMSSQLPSTLPIQPQPATSLSNIASTKPPQSVMSYNPPATASLNSGMLQPSNVNMNVLSATETPSPYASHERHSTVTSSYRTETQQPSVQPPTNNTGVPSSFRTDVLQPQLAQSTQPAVSPQFTGSAMSSTMSSGGTQPPAGNPNAFGTSVLQPQQSNILMSAQPVSTFVRPQTSNIHGNFAQQPVSSPLQMQGSPRMPGHNTSNVVDPRAHSSTVLLPQKPMTSAGMPYGTNTASVGTTGLFQQPLIAAPPTTQAHNQGTSYRMSSGANPFSDINDLL